MLKKKLVKSLVYHSPPPLPGENVQEHELQKVLRLIHSYIYEMSHIYLLNCLPPTLWLNVLTDKLSVTSGTFRDCTYVQIFCMFLHASPC